MKRIILLLSLSILTVLAGQIAFSQLATSQIPEMISYQGILTDLDGTPLNGTYNLTVRVYRESTDGTALWEETHNDVSVTNGLFNVLLGSVNSLTIAFDEPYYLGLSVNGGDELTPRLPFSSVATAFVAQIAYRLAPDENGNITLNSNTIISGTVSASQYCDENGQNCVSASNLGGGGWVDVPLDDTSDFEPWCEYRVISSENYYWYPEMVGYDSMIFEVSTSQWRLGRILATEKGALDRVIDGNINSVVDNNFLYIDAMQKRCGSSGNDGFGNPDFDSDWFEMQSQAGADSFREIEHNLGDYPSRVKVLVKAVDGANEGFIFEGMGASQSDDDVNYGDDGGLIFAYNQTKVRLWAPDQHEHYPDGSIIDIADGWGEEINSQKSHTAEVRVLVWR